MCIPSVLQDVQADSPVSVDVGVEHFGQKFHYCKFKYILHSFYESSAADPYPGSGAFLTPGSGIRNRFFTDPGYRIPDPKAIFLRA